ncbi:uncharacterized protein E6C27_scaffold114G001400 [Cucumis melo var. makuwa]|uniref:DUF4218 domain-containing protein n=1 Tax=Cucumis melo var. makuwa TaxID=1194695 RepID=A0A5A7TZD9_CUCMM|nr:uncharacterized protein E6C27_scaffold114G001400 [Cucumis melo var. makuwa]
MRWHKDKLVETDDVLRHPVDMERWKHFDCEFPDFASDSRNMHLGLASDRVEYERYQACPICIGDRLSFGYKVEYLLWDIDYFSENHIRRRVGYTMESWMYPIEISLRTLKQSVQNKAHPKGSIVEAYVMNESNTFCNTDTFCSYYVSVIETQFTRDEQNDDFIPDDEVIGEFKIFKQKVQPLVDYVENEQLNVLEIVVDQRVDEHVEDNTLCRLDINPTMVERPIVVDVGKEWIDVVKGDLQRHFVLDFNDQAMNTKLAPEDAHVSSSSTSVLLLKG